MRMKVVLLCSPSWLRRERALLGRLLVGLIDQSIEVVLVTPLDSLDTPWGATEQFNYTPSRWPWIQMRSLASLTREVGECQPDLIHCLDASLQAPAAQWAESLQLPLVCGVWSLEEAAYLAAPRHTETIYLPASRGFVQACRRRLGDEARIEPLPPGVYVAERPGPHNVITTRIPCWAVVGDGRLDAHYQALLEGIALARRTLGDVACFFCSTSFPQHDLWQTAGALGLSDCINLTPDLDAARPLLLQSDLLLQPQPLGRVHTLLVEAMARNTPVLAGVDTAVDYLVDGKTARLLPGPDPASWSSALIESLRSPQSLAHQCESAHRHILNNHKASLFISHLVRAYQQISSSPLAFA